ncbi:MAG: hypothetical protein WBW94_05720 [Anaerolineales bacterium]
MKRFLKRLEALSFSERSIPFLLFLLAALTYGLFFWQRGFYWDEEPWTWIYYRLGPAALTQTFSTSRPFWGMIYQLTLPIIGPVPWRWQVLVVIMRWLTALLVWAVLRQVWPKNPHPALWTSLLFLVYPALGQNFVALMYTHFYIVLNCFLLSLYFSILAIRVPSRRLLFTILAVALALVNLITMEYFYFLELFRVVLFWFVLDAQWKEKIRRVALLSIPYLLAFLSVSFWRAFFFKNQNASYGYVALSLIRQSPIGGIESLLKNIFFSFLETVFHAWFFPFQTVDVSLLGPRTTALAFGLAILSMLLIGLYLYCFSRFDRFENNWVRQAFILGAFAWLFAGGSFWLVGIQPQLHFSEDRFTMPFMLGSSLLIVALIGLLKAKPKIQYILLALLVGFSVGKQFQTNTDYRRDWTTQRDFFWQMSWRIPSLAPDSAILVNDLPVTYSSDNSLSGPLNWMYSPAGQMDHILFFASIRTGVAYPALEPNLPIHINYLAKVFDGNTSRVVAIKFDPPSCLRVLDPEIDSENRLLPEFMRKVAALNNYSMINPSSPVMPPPSFYFPEISHGWCYYFEQADLARQLTDWPRITKLGDIAFHLNDYPNDPVERFVFIEGYAHEGDWSEAKELSLESYRVSPSYVSPLLCILWNRIDRETPNSSNKETVMNDLLTKFSCVP